MAAANFSLFTLHYHPPPPMTASPVALSTTVPLTSNALWPNRLMHDSSDITNKNNTFFFITPAKLQPLRAK